MNNLLRILAAFDPDTLKIPHVSADSALVPRIFQMVFAIAGALALMMITLAGFRYTISGGEPAAVQKAKNQIIYSVIGLVVAIAGFSIVSFVISRI